MRDLDDTLKSRALASAPKVISGPDSAHPLHPRMPWVRDGAQPGSTQYDLASYARIMEKINDWFAAPGRDGQWGDFVLDGQASHAANDRVKPKKGQTKEELVRQREGKPADHMNLSTRGKALFARRLLIEWWKDPSKSNWSKTMIRKWETKTVRVLIERYGIHVSFIPELDDHLPASLKKKMAT